MRQAWPLPRPSCCCARNGACRATCGSGCCHRSAPTVPNSRVLPPYMAATPPGPHPLLQPLPLPPWCSHPALLLCSISPCGCHHLPHNHSCSHRFCHHKRCCSGHHKCHSLLRGWSQVQAALSWGSRAATAETAQQQLPTTAAVRQSGPYSPPWGHRHGCGSCSRRG